MKKRITVFLDEVELKNLESLIKKHGGSYPQMLKECFKLRHIKENPGYNESRKKEKPKPELTKAQICVALKGFPYSDLCKFSDKNVPLEEMGTGEYIIKE